MKKSLLILLCLPLMFSCGNNENDNASSSKEKNKALDKLAEIFSKECIEGNEGDPDWEAYCDCAARNYSNQIKEMDWKDMSDITEDDAFAMGMNAGLDCLDLLENNDVVQTDKREEMMYNMLYEECLTGNEGNSDWEEYCKCAAENMMEAVPNINEWENLSDDDAMEIGMQAGMECLDYLE
jgi:hypothetical protein